MPSLLYGLPRLPLLFLLLCVGGALAQCRQLSEQSLYLLPNRFVGSVVIAFDQPDGVPAEYRGSARLYRIPANGVLHTQFKPNYGFHIPDLYYYVDKKGSIVKSVLYFDTTRDVPAGFSSADTICFRATPLKDSKTPSGHYVILSIGPIIKADSVFELQEGIIRKL